MKRIVFSLVAIAAIAAFGMTETERRHLRMLAERPRCEARERVVIGGTTNIVETWRRGGYEWKQTNAVRRVIGIVQRNTFEERLAEMRTLAEQWRTEWQSATNSVAAAEARATIAEARAARAEALKAWLVEQRDKAVLPSTKAIYQAIIDRMEEAGK